MLCHIVHQINYQRLSSAFRRACLSEGWLSPITSSRYFTSRRSFNVQLPVMKTQLIISSALLLLLSYLGAVSAATPIMCALPSLKLGATASNC